MSWGSLLGGARITNDTPVPLVSKFATHNPLSGFFGGRREDRIRQLEAMDATATLFGVIDKLSRLTSLVEWQLCEKAKKADDEPKPLEGPRAARALPLQVWNSPNPFMSRADLVRRGQQSKDLCGEMWWVIERVGGLPAQLWPVRADRMFPVPSTTRFIAGYIYRSPDGEEVPLQVEDVLATMDPSRLDPYRGQSPIGALAMDLSASDAQQQWQAATYRNGAQPGGVITVGRRLSDTEWDELSERWRFEHQGVQNAGRVAVLEEGSYTPLPMTQRDMQFVESRNLTRQAIFDAYGFPKFGIGDVDDVNRASADASLTLMAQSLTIPRLEDIRGTLNSRFLPLFGDLWKNYEFNYVNPVPADAESERLDLTAKANAFVALLGARVVPTDAAEVCGLPEMEIEEPEPAPAALGEEAPQKASAGGGADGEKACSNTAPHGAHQWNDGAQNRRCPGIKAAVDE